MAAKWEYEITEVTDFPSARAMIDDMGDHGWELINGSTTVQSGTRHDAWSPESWSVTTYTFFWRKPVN